MLLRLSEDHFDKGNGLNSTLDIKVCLLFLTVNCFLCVFLCFFIELLKYELIL